MDVSGAQEEWSDEESLFSVFPKTTKGTDSHVLMLKKENNTMYNILACSDLWKGSYNFALVCGAQNSVVTGLGFVLS